MMIPRSLDCEQNSFVGWYHFGKGIQFYEGFMIVPITTTTAYHSMESSFLSSASSSSYQTTSNQQFQSTVQTSSFSSSTNSGHFQTSTNSEEIDETTSEENEERTESSTFFLLNTETSYAPRNEDTTGENTVQIFDYQDLTSQSENAFTSLFTSESGDDLLTEYTNESSTGHTSSSSEMTEDDVEIFTSDQSTFFSSVFTTGFTTGISSPEGFASRYSEDTTQSSSTSSTTQFISKFSCPVVGSCPYAFILWTPDSKIFI